jgi:serine/threonine-protein kinase HipA
LPNIQRFYTWDRRFPPYFETFLPEGYLFEIFKNMLTKKYGYVDDYLLNSLLSPNIEGRIKYKSNFKTIGKRMLDSWRLSLTDMPIKEIADDTIRAWRED